MIVLGSKGGVLGSNRPWIRYNVIRSRNVPAMGWYFSSRVLSRRPHFQWSEPQNFGTILFIINSNINSETPYFATLEKTLPKRMVFNMSSLKSPPIAVIPCRARKWTSIFNVLKVPLSGSLLICSCLSHTRHTVVPTHHSIYPLSFTLDVAKTKIKALYDQLITIIQPFTSGYMDLRWFSDG